MFHIVNENIKIYNPFILNHFIENNKIPNSVINDLCKIIQDCYKEKIIIEIKLHTDPEEGCSNIFFYIFSDIQDYKAISFIDDLIFEIIYENKSLYYYMDYITISHRYKKASN